MPFYVRPEVVATVGVLAAFLNSSTNVSAPVTLARASCWSGSLALCLGLESFGKSEKPQKQGYSCGEVDYRADESRCDSDRFNKRTNLVSGKREGHEQRHHTPNCQNGEGGDDQYPCLKGSSNSRHLVSVHED